MKCCIFFFSYDKIFTGVNIDQNTYHAFGHSICPAHHFGIDAEPLVTAVWNLYPVFQTVFCPALRVSWDHRHKCKHILLVSRMYKTEPGIRDIRKVCCVMVSQHLAELIAPHYGGNGSGFVIFKGPHSGLQNIVDKGEVLSGRIDAYCQNPYRNAVFVYGVFLKCCDVQTAAILGTHSEFHFPMMV